MGFTESKLNGYMDELKDKAFGENNKNDSKVADPLEITMNEKSSNNVLDEPVNTNQVQKNNEVDPEATFHSQPTHDVENTFRANAIDENTNRENPVPIEENGEANQNEAVENGSIEVQGSTERVRDLGSINGSQRNIEKDDDKKSVGEEPVKKVSSEKKISSQKEIPEVDKNEQDLQNTVD